MCSGIGRRPDEAQLTQVGGGPPLLAATRPKKNTRLPGKPFLSPEIISDVVCRPFRRQLRIKYAIVTVLSHQEVLFSYCFRCGPSSQCPAVFRPARRKRPRDPIERRPSHGHWKTCALIESFRGYFVFIKLLFLDQNIDSCQQPNSSAVQAVLTPCIPPSVACCVPNAKTRCAPSQK